MDYLFRFYLELFVAVLGLVGLLSVGAMLAVIHLIKRRGS